MPEQVRFCEGPERQRIAYAIQGTGPALVCAAWWVSPVLRALLEFLGAAPSDETPASPAVNELRKQGDVWAASYRGRRVHLKPGKGLDDLAALLAHPHQEIRALELLQGVPGSAGPAPTRDEVLDGRAKREIARRVKEIDADIDEADAAHDLGRLESLRREREVLLAELRAATGLGRRDRSLADPAERARKAVSSRIRAAIVKIRAVHPQLAGHLESTITTGLLCCYDPEPDLVWET